MKRAVVWFGGCFLIVASVFMFRLFGRSDLARTFLDTGPKTMHANPSVAHPSSPMAIATESPTPFVSKPPPTQLQTKDLRTRIPEPTHVFTKGSKFFLPELSYGMNNKRFEFISAAIMAKQLNRTLVRSDFEVRVHNTIFVEWKPFSSFFSVNAFSRVTDSVSMDEFLEYCNNTVAIKLERQSHISHETALEYFNVTVKKRYFYEYNAQSISGIIKNEPCVSMHNLWNANFLQHAVNPENSLYFENFVASEPLVEIAVDTISRLEQEYGDFHLAVHYRYGDSGPAGVKQWFYCQKRFGMQPEWVYLGAPVVAKEYWKATLNVTNCRPPMDWAAWKMQNEVETRKYDFVILATDAPSNVVEYFQSQLSVPVKRIENCEQFSDTEVALIEQEMCVRASGFMGTFVSTFSGMIAIQRKYIYNQDSKFF